MNASVSPLPGPGRRAPLAERRGVLAERRAVAREPAARVRGVTAGGFGADVVLPCLNEAESLPGVLAAKADYVCVLDADGSLPPEVLPTLVAEVAAGRADLAVGRRRPTGRGAMPWHARLGNARIAGLLRRRGVPVHDIAPVRAVRREALLALGVQDRAFGYPLELLLRAGSAGWRLYEIDVAYRPRTGGRSKVSGSVRGTARAVRDMSAALALTR